MPMRLSHFQAAEDLQIRETLPAVIDRLHKSGDVKRGRAQLAVGGGQRREVVRCVWAVEGNGERSEVEVLSERDPRQAELDRPRTRSPHRSCRGIPRPLAVHMAVDWLRLIHSSPAGCAGVTGWNPNESKCSVCVV